MPVSLTKSPLGPVTLKTHDVRHLRVTVHAGGYLLGEYVWPMIPDDQRDGWFVYTIAPDGQGWPIERQQQRADASAAIVATATWYDYRPHPVTVEGGNGRYRIQCRTCDGNSTNYGGRVTYDSADEAATDGVDVHAVLVCPADVVGRPGVKPWRMTRIGECSAPPNSPYYRAR